jgi:hypothetical protein
VESKQHDRQFSQETSQFLRPCHEARANVNLKAIW